MRYVVEYKTVFKNVRDTYYFYIECFVLRLGLMWHWADGRLDWLTLICIC